MSKILIVEDDPMISEIYQRKFESEGFEVSIAVTGKEVLKKARENKFDLILLDLVLPEMSGIEVLHEIKHSGKYDSGAKIIIFSNLSDKENQDKALENGADGFIAKTQYNPTGLVKEIKRLLNEYHEEEKNRGKRENGNGGSDNENGKKKRILLIEDEEIFLELFGEKLKEDGYEVECAKNGAWGVNAALEKNFDLIILDMVMPAMSGREIVEQLKKEEKTKNIPLIVLSASVADEEFRKIQELGVKDYFIKTRIIPSDLSRRVTEMLSN